jgi:TolB-like protein/class 3 adenylate cyclase
MSESQLRRLTAILAADIAGYSALMGADEARTVRDLKGHQTVVLPMVGEFGGRIIDTAGDGILAEFPSVVNAVQCAVAIQSKMAERNAVTERERWMQFRIGINIGDVVYDETRIYGDGINVAARLEGIAEPSGICISGKVYEEINGKIDLAYQDIGEQQLKNIARPVQAYRISLDNIMPTATGALALPDKPSIAVLPFTNLSGDIEQEYFADGIAEDIITALARVRQFFVIARNTTFIYKGRSVDVRGLAKDLGVQYVLEGSVRRAGSRVRIIAQLVEGATGKHLWAGRYDRDLQDIFAVQDEITQMVVGAIGPELSRAEQNRARLKSPNSLGAWDFYQRGMWHLWRLGPQDIRTAIELFKSSIELDPSFSSALAALSYAHSRNFIRGYTDMRRAELQSAYDAAVQAVSLDKENAIAHWALGIVYSYKREHQSTLEQMSIAMKLNPSFAQVFAEYGQELTFCGRSGEAFPYFDQAERISPNDPFAWQVWFGRGWAHFFLGQFEEAAACARVPE